MIEARIDAPRVNRLVKTDGGKAFKKLPNGKRAPAVQRPVWLTANQRLAHQQRAKHTDLWRSAAATSANHLPTGMTGKWFVVAEIHLPHARSYDATNYAPTTKACLDGIVSDHGFLPDDNNDYIVGPLHLPGSKSADRFGHLWLMFYDLNSPWDRKELAHTIESLA